MGTGPAGFWPALLGWGTLHGALVLGCLCWAGEQQGGSGCLAQRRGYGGLREEGLGVSQKRVLGSHRRGSWGLGIRELRQAWARVPREQGGRPSITLPLACTHTALERCGPPGSGCLRSLCNPPFPLPTLLPDPSVAGWLASFRSPLQRRVRRPSVYAPAPRALSPHRPQPTLSLPRGVPVCFLSAHCCPPAPGALSSQGTAGSTHAAAPLPVCEGPDAWPGQVPQGCCHQWSGVGGGSGRGRPGPDHFLLSGFLGKEEKVQTGQGQWGEPRREDTGGPPHHLRPRVGGPEARALLRRWLRQHW